MSNDCLTRLYWVCSNQEFSFDDGRNLGELWEETLGKAESGRAFDDALSATDLCGTEEEDEVYSAYIQARCAAEECGFINGFRLGMKLAGEVGGMEVGA